MDNNNNDTEFGDDENITDYESLKNASMITKGRGLKKSRTDLKEDTKEFKETKFDNLNENAVGEHLKSVEGWVVFITNLKKDIEIDQLVDRFKDYGHILNVKLPLGHSTGYLKGYAMVEFAKYESAMAAIEGESKTEFFGNVIEVSMAFRNGPIKRTD